MPSVQRLWVGYAEGGEKVTLDVGSEGTKSILLGSRARELAALAALSAKEAGTNPIILDIGGSLARTMSGYFDTYDYRSFLYDSFRLEEPGAWHSQLAAAAYAVALDLTSEEETVINAAMQFVASEGTLLSPVSLHDIVGKVEGFRGPYVDKLSGRIGALRLFDAVEDRSFEMLTQGNILVDFHSAPYPQAGELAAALFLAKLVAISHSDGKTDGLLLLTDADRIFRASPRVMHSNRLLSTFVLQDGRSGSSTPFVPRLVQTKTADHVTSMAGGRINPDLTRRILEAVEGFPLSTPESIVSYVAPEFLPADASSALAGLERERAVILEPKDSGSGPRVFAYTLTDRGRGILKELRT